jgi:membrane-associated phospholipid phosphatase
MTRRAASLTSTLCALVFVFALWLKSQPLNAEWMLWLHAHRLQAPQLWAGLTLLGYGWALLMACSAMDRTGGRGALLALTALVVGGLLSAALKGFWEFPRPLSALPEGTIEPIGVLVRGANAFPSGHAMSAMAAAALVTAQLPLAANRRPLLALGVLLLGIAAAGSRVMVGAHWPADVLAGGALGWACGWACVAAVDRAGLAQRLPPRAGLALAMLLELLAAVSCLGSLRDYPEVNFLQYGLAACMLLSLQRRWQRLRAVP